MDEESKELTMQLTVNFSWTSFAFKSSALFLALQNITAFDMLTVS